ncbi:MAG: hypothetical protein JWN11_2463 [Hyphomicrobiales bacterium]|nr:hypothetical protein [Hyphomicrobiales bacterium]
MTVDGITIRLVATRDIILAWRLLLSAPPPRRPCLPYSSLCQAGLADAALFLNSSQDFFVPGFADAFTSLSGPFFLEAISGGTSFRGLPRHCIAKPSPTCTTSDVRLRCSQRCCLYLPARWLGVLPFWYCSDRAIQIFIIILLSVNRPVWWSQQMDSGARHALPSGSRGRLRLGLDGQIFFDHKFPPRFDPGRTPLLKFA